jgi:TolA-binding protein
VASATRPVSPNLDYRANVDRQSREQKSVGNLLAYCVYGLLAVFVLGAALAIYGSVIIFDKLHDQSTSITSLDDKYAAKVTGLDKQLAATQDTLTQAQAQISRQQELLNKEQEDLNKLLSQVSSDSDELKAERQSRAQETAALRARVRELDYRITELNPKQP